MERVVIIGCGGAGKSTLARQLGEKTGLPVVHLDRIFWKENWEHLTREEFDAAADAETEKGRWIIDGNYSRTMPRRLNACDTVIYLDFNRVFCLVSAIMRVIKNYGQCRPDMALGCNERFDMEFLRWIWTYNDRHRANNYRLIHEAKPDSVIILKNRAAVKKFLKNL